MNNLILVRHGQSLWNLEKRFTGWADIDLTEEAIIHEILHIRYSTENEDWINETTRQYIHSK